MDVTNKIRTLMDQQNALERELIYLEQKENLIKKSIAQANPEETHILLKVLRVINKGIKKREALLQKIKQEAEVVKIIMDCYDLPETLAPAINNSCIYAYA